MRHIYAVRLANARRLVEEAGNAQRFGEKIGSSKSRTSQIIGKNPIRAIGDDAAEQIEQAFGRPENWLDQDHSDHLRDMISRLTAENRAAVVELVRALLAGQKTK